MTEVRLVAAGDATLVAEFEERIDPGVNARVIALARSIADASVAGVRDVVPTFRSVAVHFDPLVTDVERLAALVHDAAQRADDPGVAEGKAVVVPVCYDEPFGPDLDLVAQFAGLSRGETIAAHAAREYRVYMLGFVPGFAYLGRVDARIAAPRRPTPRAEVAAGSVGIAGGQTGVYPSATPGGWNIIGRTPLRMITAQRTPPTLVVAGDRVRFHPIDRAAFDRLADAEEPSS